MKKLVVEKGNLQNNIDCIKAMSKSTIIAVLKGNGYGLGVVNFAKFLSKSGINFFAVAEIEEAIELRENRVDGNILLLTSTTSEDEAKIIVSNNIIPTVGSVISASIINELGKKLNKVIEVHLKIDTGFGRFGFLSETISESCDFLKSLENINIVGTYSHLSFSFSKDSEFIHSQFKKFLNSIGELDRNGIKTGILHIANSCAFLKFKSTHLDAVRIGSAFLGRIPIENIYGFKKVGHLKSKIIEVKELPKDYFIGYANTFKTRRPTRIGIVPVGYKDGFGVEKIRDTYRFKDILRYIYNDLKLINKSNFVRVNDIKLKLLGRIGMYNIIVDITDTDVKIGDDVVLEINPILVDSSIIREFI